MYKYILRAGGFELVQNEPTNYKDPRSTEPDHKVNENKPNSVPIMKSKFLTEVLKYPNGLSEVMLRMLNLEQEEEVNRI